MYRNGVNLDPALFNVLAVSMSSASNELRHGTVGIDCFRRGKLPGNDMLSFEPLFLLGLQLKFININIIQIIFYFIISM